MIVPAVDLAEHVDPPVEPVEIAEHLTEYFQAKNSPSVQESR